MSSSETSYLQLSDIVPWVTTTGSFPPVVDADSEPILDRPLTEEEVRKAIALVVVEQGRAGVDILVCGQVRGTITAIQAYDIPGYDGIRIVDRLGIPEKSRPLQDLEYARSVALENGITKPFKAHITGPSTMAHLSAIEVPEYSSDSDLRRLVLDLAHSLAPQAERFANAGFEIIQIDEPVLRPGVNLALAFEALDIINAYIPVPLIHVCRNIEPIFMELLSLNRKMKNPFQVMCVEGKHLMRVPGLRARDLEDAGVKIGFGCLDVSKESVEPLFQVERDIRIALQRFGIDNIWAVTPDCGLRRRSLSATRAKILRLVEARNAVAQRRQLAGT